MSDDADDAKPRRRTTFLDLPSELRNRVYFESGCLERYFQHKNVWGWEVTFWYGNYIVKGDYTPDQHLAVHGCLDNSKCRFAVWDDFLKWPKAFLVVDVPRDPIHKDTDSCHCDSTWTKRRLTVKRGRVGLEQPELTRVCRQVREETLAIYYGNHPFVFLFLGKNIDQKVEEALRWLDAIGPVNAGRLRDVEIVYSTKKKLRYLTTDFARELRLRGVDRDAVHFSRTVPPHVGDQVSALKELKLRW